MKSWNVTKIDLLFLLFIRWCLLQPINGSEKWFLLISKEEFHVKRSQWMIEKDPNKEEENLLGKSDVEIPGNPKIKTYNCHFHLNVHCFDFCAFSFLFFILNPLFNAVFIYGYLYYYRNMLYVIYTFLFMDKSIKYSIYFFNWMYK